MSDTPPPSVGGVILCGGRSSRMGQPKLALPFGPETMLERTIRLLKEVVSPIVVVAAIDQQLPDLDDDILIARDEEPGWGPLGGITVGLGALADLVPAAYVAPCDAPLLQPAFIQAMIEHAQGYDIAVPKEQKFYHPLAAVYRTELAPIARNLIDEKKYRPLFLIEQANSNCVDVDTLRSIDPDLDSLRNMNKPEDYQAALQAAGF